MKEFLPPLIINQISPFSLTDLKIIGCGLEKTTNKKTIMTSKDIKSFSFHFVLSGMGYVEQSNEKHLITKNNIFVLFPHSKQTYYPHKKQPWKYAWINFSGIKANELLKLMNIDEANCIIPILNKEIEKIFIGNVIECQKKPNISQFIALSNLYKIFSLILEQNVTDNSLTNNFLLDAIDYIENNYSDPCLNLSLVASHTHVTPSYLSRKFKQNLNQNFSDYLVNTRLQKAIHLLNTTTLSIQEIAYRVGYTDPYYFSNVFKKYNKCSPSQHRKNQKDKN